MSILNVPNTPISLDYRANMITMYWGNGGVVGNWIKERNKWKEQTGNVVDGDLELDEFWPYFSSVLEEILDMEEVEKTINNFKQKIEDRENGSREINKGYDTRYKPYRLEIR